MTREPRAEPATLGTCIHKRLVHLEATSMHTNISVVLTVNKSATDYTQLTGHSKPSLPAAGHGGKQDPDVFLPVVPSSLFPFEASVCSQNDAKRPRESLKLLEAKSTFVGVGETRGPEKPALCSQICLRNLRHSDLRS